MTRCDSDTPHWDQGEHRDLNAMAMHGENSLVTGHIMVLGGINGIQVPSTKCWAQVAKKYLQKKLCKKYICEKKIFAKKMFAKKYLQKKLRKKSCEKSCKKSISTSMQNLKLLA